MKSQLDAPSAFPKESFLYYMNLKGDWLDPRIILDVAVKRKFPATSGGNGTATFFSFFL
jgi:hypothetical protein